MGFVAPEFGLAMAEIVLAVGICAVLLVDLFISDRMRGLTLLLAMATLAITGFYAGSSGVAGPELTFSGSYIVDPLARVLKLFTLLMVAVVFLYSWGYLRG